MRLLLATDAWTPQVNGVVRTLEAVVARLRARGDVVGIVDPADFASVPCPGYREIRLALASPRRLRGLLGGFRADAVHIATEGPIGWAMRSACLAADMPFTTSFHSRFPEYLSARLPLPGPWVEAVARAGLRRFHNAARATMVVTDALAAELAGWGIARTRLWPRGVDTTLFHPDRRDDLGLPRPVFLHVGRLAVEKNVPAFLDLDLPGSKLVVGDGPMRAALERRYPQAVFLGKRTGEDLARLYASADAFVFPSRTDTFGNVLLEALASGLPVAALPVPGPRDVVSDPRVGCLDMDLRAAALGALALSRSEARAFACRHDWEASATCFRDIVLGQARR